MGREARANAKRKALAPRIECQRCHKMVPDDGDFGIGVVENVLDQDTLEIVADVELVPRNRWCQKCAFEVAASGLNDPAA